MPSSYELIPDGKNLGNGLRSGRPIPADCRRPPTDREGSAHHGCRSCCSGESGTGKEVVARAIHDANPRGQFVPIDCGSLVGTLMESELFGHVKGAFSGAVENKKGLVELADGGTAFFDEIGDLPLEMQVKLLRLIQEKRIPRRSAPCSGARSTCGSSPRRTATSRPRWPRAASAWTCFTASTSSPIRLPPLRERKEDIPLLVEHFLERRTDLA